MCAGARGCRVVESLPSTGCGAASFRLAESKARSLARYVSVVQIVSIAALLRRRLLYLFLLKHKEVKRGTRPRRHLSKMALTLLTLR